jgi:hypothetical protein
MHSLTRYYREIWLPDFEFYAPPGERPQPLCMVAREVVSGREVRRWLAEAPPAAPPWGTGRDTLLVAFYASAELGCALALQWPMPSRVVDLYAEFRRLMGGYTPEHGFGLLGALTAFHLPGLASTTKDGMRSLAARGGPYTAAERQALLEYCAADVAATVRLLDVLLPALDLARALVRGRYMAAAARMEWVGTPYDMTLLADLRRHWETIRAHLARTINATHPVFAPAETSLDRASAYGQAVYTLAAAWGQDPYVLATAAQHVWKARRTLYAETRDAKRRVRQRTGLTAAQIARWEQAGRDASSWPDLDAVAQEVAGDFPALGLGAGFGAVDGYDRADYAGALWALLREEDPPLRRADPALLAHAADLVDADPDGWDMARRYTFSLQRFEAYLAHHDIPWPRLPSGMLALDDDTFREMARAYPAEIGPIREARHALSQLKLHDLALGSDGRARCLLSAFGAHTSRNQPKQ